MKDEKEEKIFCKPVCDAIYSAYNELSDYLFTLTESEDLTCGKHVVLSIVKENNQLFYLVSNGYRSHHTTIARPSKPVKSSDLRIRGIRDFLRNIDTYISNLNDRITAIINQRKEILEFLKSYEVPSFDLPEIINIDEIKSQIELKIEKYYDKIPSYQTLTYDKKGIYIYIGYGSSQIELEPDVTKSDIETALKCIEIDIRDQCWDR